MSQGFSRKQQTAYGAMSLVVAILLSSGFAIWYSAKVGVESEQRARDAAVVAAANYTDEQNRIWCTALAIFTRTNPEELPPATTDAGREQRPQQVAAYKALVALRKGFHCDSNK
jgi:hypothetical protein